MRGLAALARGTDETRALTFQDIWGRGLDLGGTNTVANVTVNETRALQLLTVWGCVSLLSDSVASLPLDAYRTQAGVRTPVDPAPGVIVQPYVEMDRYDWLHRIMVSLTLRGNAFLLITRNGYGQPVELIPIHPDSISLQRRNTTRHDANLSPFITNDLVFYVQGQYVPRENILHIPAFTLPGTPWGLSPIEYARQSIGSSIATEDFGARFFGDNATPSGVLKTDKELSKQAQDDLREQWLQLHRGRRLPAVLKGGMEWQAITITPEESQFLETRKFNSHDIAGKLFRIPPHMIGDVERSTSWGTGIEQQTLGFVNFTLRPWIVRIERALSNLLPRPQYVKFSLDDLLRGDMAARGAFYATLLEHGVMNPDEARHREDLPPIPDGAGQRFFFPLNFGPLAASPAPPPEPPEASDPADPNAVPSRALRVFYDEHNRPARYEEVPV